MDDAPLIPDLSEGSSVKFVKRKRGRRHHLSWGPPRAKRTDFGPKLSHDGISCGTSNTEKTEPSSRKQPRVNKKGVPLSCEVYRGRLGSGYLRVHHEIHRVTIRTPIKLFRQETPTLQVNFNNILESHFFFIFHVTLSNHEIAKKPKQVYLQFSWGDISPLV